MAGGNGLIGKCPGFDGSDFAEDFFGGFGIIPEIRGEGFFFQRLNLGYLAVVVKDTPSGQKRDPSCLSTGLWSWFFVYRLAFTVKKMSFRASGEESARTGKQRGE
jgi:hypothetical protein